jgi:malate dehydrogenase (oxaloacetate-decarboxylating)(NADP+)
MKCYVTEDELKQALAGATSFKSFCDILVKTLPANFAEIAIDVFTQYQWQPKSDGDSKYVEIPKNVKQGKVFAFNEAGNFKAVHISKDDGIAIPILLGNRNKIQQIIEENQINLVDVQIIDPMEEEAKRNSYAEILYKKRQRRGMSLHEAKKLMRDRHYFAPMMVETGEADAMISGLTKNYPSTIRPALQILGKEENTSVVAGMYIMLSKKGTLFFADCTVNPVPSVDELVDISKLAHNAVKKFNRNPRMALLSYSNFGSASGDVPSKMSAVRERLKKEFPYMVVDGEIQANIALNQKLLNEDFPFSELNGEPVNTLIFPSLSSGNITYKMLQELGAAEAVGPVLLGLKKSAHVLQLGSSIREIVNMVTIAVVDAQRKKESK